MLRNQRISYIVAFIGENDVFGVKVEHTTRENVKKRELKLFMGLHKEGFVVDDEVLEVVRKEVIFGSITRKGLEICFQFVIGHEIGV